MTDIHCGLTGKQYNITDQESKDLIDKFRKFTEEYFKSRVPDGKIAREKVVNFYETFLWASVERGISTKSEIEDLLKCKDIMTEAVEEHDLNKDGFLDLSEFKSFIVEFESKWMEKEVKKYDLDGDGFITREEVDIVLSRMGDHHDDGYLEKLFNFVFENFDTDGDGRISLPEWYNAFRHIKW